MEILIIILWVAYGIFTGIQMIGNEYKWTEDDLFLFTWIVMLSPLIFSLRVIYGAFFNLWK